MSDEDREANQFAMELLMPEELVRREIKSAVYTFSEKGIRKLAKKFGVEEHIMSARLVQLGFVPGITA